MKLGAMDNIPLACINLGQPPAVQDSVGSKETGFFNYLKEALQEVDELQKEAHSVRRNWRWVTRLTCIIPFWLMRRPTWPCN